MKRLRECIPLLLFLAVATSAWAIRGTPIDNRVQTLLVSSTSVGLNTNICRPTSDGTSAEGPALIQIKDNQIYYRLDSSTATVGQGDYLGNPGDILELDVPSKFRAIRATATNARVMATCFTR